MANPFKLTFIIGALDKATPIFNKVAKTLKFYNESTTKISKGFESFKNFSKNISKGFTFAKDIFNKIAIPILAGATAFAFLTNKSIETGDSLSKFAERSGLAVDQFFSLQRVAQDSGLEFEEFGSSIETFNKNLGKLKLGKGALNTIVKDAFPTLNKELKNAKTTEEALQKLFATIEKIKDPSKKVALSSAAFGNPKLLSVLDKGTKGLEEMRAAQLALFGSQEKFAKNTAESDDILDSFGATLSATNRKFYAEFLPGLNVVAGAFDDLIKKNTELSAAIGKTFSETLISSIADLKETFADFAVVLYRIKPIATDLAKLFKVFIFITSILGKLLIYLGAYLLSFWAPIKEFFKTVFNFVYDLVSSILGLFKALFTFDLDGIVKNYKAFFATFNDKNNPFKAFSDKKQEQDEGAETIRNNVINSEFFKTIEAADDKNKGIDRSVNPEVVRNFLPVQRPIDNQNNMLAQINPLVKNSITENSVVVKFENVPRGTQIKPQGKSDKVKLEVGYIQELAK